MQGELSPDKKMKVALVQEEFKKRTKRMKYDLKGIWPESKIASAWAKIGDTNLGHMDYDDFHQRMFGNAPTQLA